MSITKTACIQCLPENSVSLQIWARLFESTQSLAFFSLGVQISLCTPSITMAIGDSKESKLRESPECVTRPVRGSTAKGRLKVSGAAECASSANILDFTVYSVQSLSFSVFTFSLVRSTLRLLTFSYCSHTVGNEWKELVFIVERSLITSGWVGSDWATATRPQSVCVDRTECTFERVLFVRVRDLLWLFGTLLLRDS